MKWERIPEVIDMYPMVQLFLLIVDRDGIETRRLTLERIEQKAAEHLGTTGRKLLAENAWQEIEVWAIAGQDLPRDWKWAEIRQDSHPKETYFEPLSIARKLTDEPGEGRTTLGREAAANYARVRSLCVEDVQQLETRLRAALAPS